MDREEFRKKVEEGLKELNREQVVQFAWRCGVRALPFLGSCGSFDFWNKKDRQKHIYSFFYALDVTTDTNIIVAKAANTAAANATDIIPTDIKIYDTTFYAASAVATASAVVADLNTINPAWHASNAALDTALAAIASLNIIKPAWSTAVNTDSSKYSLVLKSIIFRVLDAIKNNDADQHNLTDLYGEVWDNFQKALDAEGCTYWGRLYKGIFDSGLVLDEKALEEVQRRVNVPKEIQELGAAAVANYLEELERKGAKRLNEARIIVLGDKGAGKTSIARKLIDLEAPMPTEKESTAGVDTMLWELEDEDINVRIWDFAGHVVTHAVHQFFLSERCLYIMVYDGRTEERNRLEYWLNHMKNYGGDSQAIILVNKRDGHSVEIPINFLKEQFSIKGLYEFSIQDDFTDLMLFRQDVAEYIKNNPSWEKQEFPANYYQVKGELENIFVKSEKERGQEHITKEKFDKIAKKHDVKDSEKLLKDLHFLGVSLWYSEIKKFNMLVLNPEWISHGVYKIINWVNEEKKYSLPLEDFVTVFKDDKDRYPEEKHKFLFMLMKHYELAYETDGGELIIPHLLKEDRPEKLPDFQVGESLMSRYKTEQPLPPNTISRFIVKHNQEIKKEKENSLVWRYGVVLEDSNGSLALVREEKNTISVSVKGEKKTNYLNRLRQTMNNIFNSYKSDKPELQYRIERFGKLRDELERKEPIWLPDSKIFILCQREKPYYDEIADQNIFMKDVVINYNINNENVISRGKGNRIIKPTFNFKDCNIGLQSNLNELATFW